MLHTPARRPENLVNPYPDTRQFNISHAVFEEGVEATLKALEPKLDAFDDLLEALELVTEHVGLLKDIYQFTKGDDEVTDTIIAKAKVALAKAQEKRE